jgi:hypothetical protein
MLSATRLDLTLLLLFLFLFLFLFFLSYPGVGVQRGAQRRGAMCGETLRTPTRSYRIKYRMKVRITFVTGSAILPSSLLLFLPLFLLFDLYSKVRALITCLEINFVD